LRIKEQETRLSLQEHVVVVVVVEDDDDDDEVKSAYIAQFITVTVAQRHLMEVCTEWHLKLPRNT